MNILVVDDEFSACELMAGKIRALGLEGVEGVFCAGSGEEALGILSKTPCQLMVTDICMAPMDGLELIEEAKRIFPDLICVLISAYDEFSYAHTGIRLGIQDYWLKPYSEAQIEASLSRILEEYRISCHKSRFILDTLVSEAILSGEKAMDDVFADLPAYPGGEGRVFVWSGALAKEPSLPGIWTYRLQNREILLAAGAEAPLTDESALAISAQIGKICGISAPGRNIAALYRQAAYALSLGWVWKGRRGICCRPVEEAALKAAAQRLAHRAMAADRAVILSEIAAKEQAMDAFSFAVLVSGVYTALLSEAADLLGQCRGGMILPGGQGWREVLQRLLGEISEAKQNQIKKGKPDPIRWVTGYIEEHFAEELDMTVLANRLDISYQYFSRLFHAQTGRTFSEYILNVRMKEACRLLLRGEPVAEVAKKVGYQYPYNFTRAFKKLYGVSPNAFRRKEE